MVKIIDRFSEISNDYRALFCDLWGCIHNGQQSFKKALDALFNFRKNGGYVILLTNAPRPRLNVIKFLTNLGITAHFYDDIITSGDATQFDLKSGTFGSSIYHVGPPHDLCFFDFENVVNESHQSSIELVPLTKASAIVCTGLFNDKTETPSDYTDLIDFGIKKNLPLLCANPDLQVDYGHRRLWCAGAIAKKYDEAGGKTIYFGKPHKPIYDLAMSKLHNLDQTIEKSEILCVGDGALTDMLGGISYSLDTLFVAGGLSGQDTGVENDSTSPDREKLDKFLNKISLMPTASIGYFQ